MAGQPISLRDGIYRCAKCRHVTNGPRLPDISYGEFLLWSEAGTVRHLNAINDSTYKEWLALVEQLRPDVDRTSEAFLTFAQETYGPVVCDADPSGHSFTLGDPLCPDGCEPMLDWEPSDERVDVPSVTHRRWDEADAEARSEIGKRFLASGLEGSPQLT